jgi:hypothetical protein
VIFQPAIIALLLASLVCVSLLVASAPFAFDIIRHWNIQSGSERQLVLERRTYLLSTLLTFVFATQLVALLLFVFNADRMSSMFVGAMCAVGTLNVNVFGFPALLAQIVVFFLAASWLVINHVDTRACDYPLVRVKYMLLLALLPLLLVAAVLQLRYFLGLKADVITSCCGSLFSAETPGVTGDAAASPPLPTMIAFYAALTLAAGTSLFYRLRQRGAYFVALFSGVAFVVAMAGILSFISLYIYEHPHHHCPFCVLKPEYHYQGYWLYLPLFIGTAAGLGVGAIQPFARIPSLTVIVPAVARKLATLSMVMWVLFALVASFMILNSRLVLLEG